MTTAGTIDRPTTHNPQLRLRPVQDPAMTSVPETPDRPEIDAKASRQRRTREMQLMPESLARAHMHDRLHEAEAERRALRVTSARRLPRRAIAMAVMQ
jgi:hypothetical protein